MGNTAPMQYNEIRDYLVAWEKQMVSTAGVAGEANVKACFEAANKLNGYGGPQQPTM